MNSVRYAKFPKGTLKHPLTKAPRVVAQGGTSRVYKVVEGGKRYALKRFTFNIVKCTPEPCIIREKQFYRLFKSCDFVAKAQETEHVDTLMVEWMQGIHFDTLTSRLQHFSVQERFQVALWACYQLAQGILSLDQHVKENGEQIAEIFGVGAATPAQTYQFVTSDYNSLNFFLTPTGDVRTIDLGGFAIINGGSFLVRYVTDPNCLFAPPEIRYDLDDPGGIKKIASDYPPAQVYGVASLFLWIIGGSDSKAFSQEQKDFFSYLNNECRHPNAQSRPSLLDLITRLEELGVTRPEDSLLERIFSSATQQDRVDEAGDFESALSDFTSIQNDIKTHPERALYLIQQQPDLTGESVKELFKTALEQSEDFIVWELFEIIKKRHIDIKDLRLRNQMTPLHWAAGSNSPLFKTFLGLYSYALDEGNEKGVTPLFSVSTLGYSDIARQLIKAGADVHKASNGFTPLFMAAHSGHTVIVRQLLAAGADVHKASNGVTPLFMAAYNGHTDIVRLLLAAGADVHTARTTDGVTPLFMAARNGHADIVRQLLDAGADDLTILMVEKLTQEISNILFQTYQSRFDQYSPLSQAIQRQDVNEVKTLLEGGADPEDSGDENCVIPEPIMQAIRIQNIAIIELLLQYIGSQEFRRKCIDLEGNYTVKTCHELALSTKNPEVIALFD